MSMGVCVCVFVSERAHIKSRLMWTAKAPCRDGALFLSCCVGCCLCTLTAVQLYVVCTLLETAFLCASVFW